MDTEHRQSVIARWLVAIGGALALLINIGYSFQINDQLQYLLLPYREIFPHFAPDDWFTWKTSHYHVVYAWIIEGFFALTGERYLPQAIFLAHLGTLVWLCYGIVRVSQAYGVGRTGAIIALLVIALVRHEGLAGSTFTHGQLVPADLALPPLLLACAAWLERSFLRAGIWLGVAAILHSNYAVLGPGLLGLSELGLWLLAKKRQATPRDMLAMVVGYLPLATPSLWLIASGFLASDAAPQAIDTIFRVRSPHHYDLSVMECQDLWWPLWLLTWAAPGLWAHWRSRPSPGLALLAATTGWLLLAVAGGWLSSGPLARLFLWRLSPVWILLALCEVARFWRASDRSARAIQIRKLWMVAGAFGSACFARSDMALVAAFGITPTWFGLPAVLATGAAGAAALRGRVAILAGATLFSMVTALQVVASPGVPHERSGAIRKASMRGPRIGRFVWDETHPHIKEVNLMRWVRARTPVDAKFLIPPSMISFRLRTRRAVFVDFKAAPMRGDQVLEWKRRMLLAMGTSRFPATGYALRFVAGTLYERRGLPELAKLARAEGMDYIVTRPKHHAGRARLKREIVVDDYAVYRVLPRGSRSSGDSRRAHKHAFP